MRVYGEDIVWLALIEITAAAMWYATPLIGAAPPEASAVVAAGQLLMLGVMLIAPVVVGANAIARGPRLPR